jgi:hypothetical protein
VTTTNGAVYVTNTTAGFGISDANIGGGGGKQAAATGRLRQYQILPSTAT